MAKEPFERVFSLVERKKLLNRVAKERKKIIVKNSLSDVFEFHPIFIDPSTQDLTGEILGFAPTDAEVVVAMFYVDADRYFMTTRLRLKEGYWILLSDPQFFKFNRRSAFRVGIPAEIEVNFYISTIRNIELNRSVPILDISATGARISWTSETRLAKGTILHGALQWGKGKVLPVDAA